MASPSIREAHLPHRVVWRPLRSAPGSNEGLYVAGLRSTIHRDQESDLPDAVVQVAYHSQADRSISASLTRYAGVNHFQIACSRQPRAYPLKASLWMRCATKCYLIW